MMNTDLDFPRVIVLLATALAIGIGSLVLIGWVLDIDALKSVFSDWHSMKVNTAICFVLVGLAFLSSVNFNSTFTAKYATLITNTGKFCELLIFTLGSLTLVEYIVDWDIGIDQWLFSEPENSADVSHSERMAPETSFCFVILAIASRYNKNLTTDYQRIAVLIIGLLVWAIALATLLSYFILPFNAFGWFGYNTMAVHSGILFALLGGAVIVNIWQQRLSFWSLSNKVSLMVAVGIVLLVFIGLNDCRTQYGAKTINQQIVLLEEIQADIERITAEVINNQADTRGYVISGDNRFLNSFLASKAISLKEMDKLEKIMLTLFPSAQHQQHLKQIKAVVKAQLEWHEKIINAKKNDIIKTEYSHQIIYGTELLLNLRRTFAKIQIEHQQMLQTLKEKAEFVSDVSFFITFTGTLTSLILFLSALLELNFVEFRREATSEFLRISENRYRSLVENIPIAILEIDLYGQVLTMNRCAILMRSDYQDNLLNSFYLDWVHPTERGQIKELLKKAYSGEIIHFEFRTHRAAKQILKSCLIPVKNKAGEIKKLIAIAEDVTQNKRIEQTHIFLSQTVRQYNDETFFESLARYLSDCLEMSFVCIDRLEGDGLNATTLAVYNNGKFEDNITYSLQDTPCGQVVGQAICCFPSCVCQFFPNDEVLKTLRAESYIGATLWNSTGNPIGLIAVIDTKPLADKALAEEILKTVAVRAESELERLLTEEELQKSEKKHRAILETAMDGVWLTDLQGHLLEVNDAYCRMSGYSMSELLRMRISDLAVDKTSFEITEHIQEIINKSEDRFESKHLRKDGGFFDVEISAQYHADEGGYFVVFVHDITERKQVETELRIAATVFEAQEGMTVTDANGMILKVNQAFTRISGYSSAEAVGKNPRILKSKRHDETFYLRLWLQLCEVGMWQGEIWNRRKNGEEYPEWLTITAVKNSQGLTTHYVGTFIDITKRKHAEEAMKEAELRANRANQAKSEFLANMSHEIRTPMNAILGFSTLLTDLITDSVQRHYLNAIVVSGEILLQLINDVLDLSKIEAGKLELIPNCIEIKRIFADIQLIFMQKVTEKGLRFVLEIHENVPPFLLLDETRLRQILLNIIGNAVKFTDKGGIQVVVTALPAEANQMCHLTIEVSDTGIGIGDDQLEEIFTAFTQQRQQSKKYGGTGLGLTICKRLAEMMGGTINVSSTQGQGSCFTIELPNIEICDNPVLLKPMQSLISRNIHFQPASILLVDDSEINRELIKVYLADYPELEIVEADSGEQALNLIRQQHFDLIFMDRVLQGENGDSVCAKIRKLKSYADTPIIMISASVLLTTPAHTPYNLQLNKPVSRVELLAAMQFFLPMDTETQINPQQVFANSPQEALTVLAATENWPELVELLKANYLTHILTLSQSGIFEINTLLTIADQLIEIAGQYHCEPLADWAVTLKTQTKLFDIKNLTETLSCFPKILVQLQR